MALASYTITIEQKLADRIEGAAKTSKISAGDLIAECVLQHFDVASRHRALIERLEVVDQGLLDLASFIGEATAETGQIDLSRICKYSTAET